jgi:aryl-alcohol dehydrogenase-like predicted oxidoreductase
MEPIPAAPAIRVLNKERNMEFRRLGRSGLKVTPLCLGAMMFGVQTDEATSLAIVDSAREAGVNFIDTADTYGAGKSEEVVGRAVKADRDRWVIATKVGHPAGAPIASGPDLSRKYVMHAVDASLRRLGTDYIDLYYLHHDDASTPLEETIRALADLVRQGKIRYFGLSNFPAWRLAEAVRVCDQLGIDRPAAMEPLYNAMNRMAEAELLPACRYYGVGVVPYSPLARGILSGKYTSLEQLPADSRAARQDKRILQTELRAESIELARQIKAHAESRGSTASRFALRWVLDNALVDAVIAGPRTMAQWTDYLEAMKADFTADDEALVDRLVAAGHPSTPGFTDPQYPVTGRVPRTAGATR